MEFVSLSSGSKGNAAFINTGKTRILIDCGISAKKAGEALKSLGTSLREIDALLLTHEHSDHIKGVKRLMQAYGVPVYATRGTLGQLARVTRDEYFSLAGRKLMEEIYVDREFVIGDIRITPFGIYHDVAEPCAYRCEVWQDNFPENDTGRQTGRQASLFGEGTAGDAGGRGAEVNAADYMVQASENTTVGGTERRRHVRVAVMTDCGHFDDYITDYLKGLDAMLLEANHDTDMLARGPYPPYLKSRIRSPYGHLSNEDSGMLLTRLLNPRLRAVLLGHLSHENNTAELALSTVRGELAREFGRSAGSGQGSKESRALKDSGREFGPDISVAPQDGLSKVIRL